MLPLTLVVWQAGQKNPQSRFHFELPGPEMFLHMSVLLDLSETVGVAATLPGGGQSELALTSL